MSLNTLTGLELMQLARDLPKDVVKKGISSVIPMQIIDVEEGAISFTAQADERHINPMGGVHGGFAATVLDSATGCAIHTLLGAGVGYGTVDLNIKMVRPLPLNKELFARGEVINKSRRLAISEASIKDSEGKIYAHGTATCMILEA